MKKLILVLTLIGFLSLSNIYSLNIFAQDSALPAPTQESTQQGESVLPIGDTEDESTKDSNSSGLNEDNTRSFVNGVGVGALVGAILGATIAWLFKDKIIK